MTVSNTPVGEEAANGDKIEKGKRSGPAPVSGQGSYFRRKSKIKQAGGG